MKLLCLLRPISLALAASCAAPTGWFGGTRSDEVLAVFLDHATPASLRPVRSSFVAANPGYDLRWHAQLAEVEGGSSDRVLFIQRGAGTARLQSVAGEASSELAVGDIVLLRSNESLTCTGDLGALSFSLPEPLPSSLPAFVRPDWDPAITDTPGGCAEEGDAYRRILLTWLPEKGPYILHSLNAHRVRITDSFSHYHPLEGGFDEFYLVQEAGPGARLFTSEEVPLLEDPGAVTRADLAHLIDERALHAGDLVYLPRGTMHRGVGGAVVQVISVPGFKPNSEIGLDHRLRAINERLGLEGSEALPFNSAASASALVK